MIRMSIRHGRYNFIEIMGGQISLERHLQSKLTIQLGKVKTKKTLTWFHYLQF